MSCTLFPLNRSPRHFLITTSVRCTLQIGHVGCLVTAYFPLEHCQRWLLRYRVFLTWLWEDVVLLIVNWWCTNYRQAVGETHINEAASTGLTGEIAEKKKSIQATQSTPQRGSLEYSPCRWVLSEYVCRPLRVRDPSSCYFAAVSLNTITTSRVKSAIFAHHRQDKYLVFTALKAIKYGTHEDGKLNREQKTFQILFL